MEKRETLPSSFAFCTTLLKGSLRSLAELSSSFFKCNTKFYYSSFTLWLKSRHVMCAFVDCLFCLKQKLLISRVWLVAWCVLLLPPKLGFSVRPELISLYLSAKVRTRCHCCKDTPVQSCAGRWGNAVVQVALPAFPVTLHLHTLKRD